MIDLKLLTSLPPGTTIYRAKDFWRINVSSSATEFVLISVKASSLNSALLQFSHEYMKLKKTLEL